MAESLLTKRLHISGLTPSIKPEDLERRLSSFGNVKSMDGFGVRDALGDPRKFGFVTMEIGAKELAKCLNVLSGSTWKGAKLRIGEAKPDFQERLACMNSRPPQPVRPKRTYARNHGCASITLPLTPLSPTGAVSTPGWISTPSGRVVRPMRMRPERPLEPVRSTVKDKVLNGKVKKRTKPPPVRARRRLIDPTKWDSVYLKGVFLDAIPVPLTTSIKLVEHPRLAKRDIVDEEDDRETSENDTDGDAFSASLEPPRRLIRDPTHIVQSVRHLRDSAILSSPTHEATESIDVRDETNAALTMLGELFGDKEDWDGRESVDEMGVLAGDEARDQEMQTDDEGDIEIIPRDLEVGERKQAIKGEGNGKQRMAAGVRFADDEDDVEEALERDVEMKENAPPVHVEASALAAAPADSVPGTNLKALFAPREDASFSLVDHLDIDIDLELDVDILGISAPSGASQEHGHRSEPTSLTFHGVEIPATIPASKSRPRVTLDPAFPLLFSPTDSLPHPYAPSPVSTTTRREHGVPSCLFPSVTRVRGLYHLPPSTTFCRTPEDTTESIHERWEKDKSSLTHEWKKAWREARGSRRGRVGAGGEIGGGY